MAFRHSEQSEESLIEEILHRYAPQNDANRYFATAPLYQLLNIRGNIFQFLVKWPG